jgi:diguanylate cyclase (GGDEF)-like protein
MVDSKNETRMLQFVRDQVADPEQFIREVERINPTTETSEDEVVLKDGRVLSRRSVPFEEDGASAARIWIFTDVTEARHARIDALCGIPNHRAYSADFPQFVEAADDGLVRAVGIMDIDNFKVYNDHYGHAAGDLVLRQIGALLRRYATNPDDLVFRIGGEEFLVACKTREATDALAFFEALRTSVTDMQLRHVGNVPYGVVTASIGLCIFRMPKIASDLFDDVDRALYRAKDAGRNVVELTA